MPREHMLVDAVDECAIEIEKQCRTKIGVLIHAKGAPLRSEKAIEFLSGTSQMADRNCGLIALRSGAVRPNVYATWLWDDFEGVCSPSMGILRRLACWSGTGIVTSSMPL